MPEPLENRIDRAALDRIAAPKVFRWKTVDLTPGVGSHLCERHPIREITTRRCHPGPHRIELTIAGEAVAEAVFDLRAE